MPRPIYVLTSLCAVAGIAVAEPVPQGVTESIAPEGSTPKECTGTGPGKFVLSPVDLEEASSGEEKAAKRRAIDKRDQKQAHQLGHKRGEGDEDGLLECNLEDGVLKDQADRIGYIASNYQYVWHLLLANCYCYAS